MRRGAKGRKMKKYYWAIYEVKKYGWNEKGISTGCSVMKHDEVLKVHPIQHQIDMNNEYGKEFLSEPPIGHKSREDWQLLNFVEITKKDFDKYDGWVG